MEIENDRTISSFKLFRSLFFFVHDHDQAYFIITISFLHRVADLSKFVKFEHLKCIYKRIAKILIRKMLLILWIEKKGNDGHFVWSNIYGQSTVQSTRTHKKSKRTHKVRSQIKKQQLILLHLFTKEIHRYFLTMPIYLLLLWFLYLNIQA